MTKVVYNDKHGGFSVSKKCIERMVELKSEEARKALEHSPPAELFDVFYISNVPRHCPIFVRVVEELGPEASGHFAKLEIAEIEGNKYYIDEYDGMETVMTPDDIEWVEI